LRGVSQAAALAVLRRTQLVPQGKKIFFWLVSYINNQQSINQPFHYFALPYLISPKWKAFDIYLDIFLKQCFLFVCQKATVVVYKVTGETKAERENNDFVEMFSFLTHYR
jgi:hypothetical protein